MSGGSPRGGGGCSSPRVALSRVFGPGAAALGGGLACRGAPPPPLPLRADHGGVVAGAATHAGCNNRPNEDRCVHHRIAPSFPATVADVTPFLA
jgi:hypothetical protein